MTGVRLVNKHFVSQTDFSQEQFKILYMLWLFFLEFRYSLYTYGPISRHQRYKQYTTVTYSVVRLASLATVLAKKTPRHYSKIQTLNPSCIALLFANK